MKNDKKSVAALFLSMFIFGTIGIFRKYIPMPSGMIAMTRGIIGMIFLIIVQTIRRQEISFKKIKKNFLLLFISGALIGFNWIMLFEAYRYTSVSVATLCYYTAPVFVCMASPIFLGEKITRLKLICVAAALIGMVFVSGVASEGGINISELMGVVLGLGAAVFYAGVIILNKKIDNIGAYDKTIVQLGTAGIVLVPYTLLAESVSAVDFTSISIFMLIIVGIIHTGIAYVLYFGAITKLKAQTAAIFSYIDPLVAVLLSVIILNESIGILGYVGAVLILGAAIFAER